MSHDILQVGDVWAVGIQDLELQNAETKRVASSSGARRLQMSDTGLAHAPLKSKVGPSALVTTKGYSTSMAVSTLRALLAGQYLKRGDGIIALPDSRRTQRLFGVNGPRVARNSRVQAPS